MYRLNELKRNVLITADEVIFHGPTKHELDHRMIESSIIVAEERIIRPTLGYDYYEAIIASKNLVITSGNLAAQQALFDASQAQGAQAYTLQEGDIVNAFEYMSAENQALWKMFLWKLTAEIVLFAAYPEGFVQFGSAGTVHNQPASTPMTGPGIVTPELRSIKWAMDKKMMDRIDPLRESMHQWLCKQKKADSTKYTLYEKTCDCNVDGVAYKRKTDFILNIYNDDDQTTNCCP